MNEAILVSTAALFEAIQSGELTADEDNTVILLIGMKVVAVVRCSFHERPRSIVGEDGRSAKVYATRSPEDDFVIRCDSE